MKGGMLVQRKEQLIIMMEKGASMKKRDKTNTGP